MLNVIRVISRSLLIQEEDRILTSMVLSINRLEISKCNLFMIDMRNKYERMFRTHWQGKLGKCRIQKNLRKFKVDEPNHEKKIF